MERMYKIYLNEPIVEGNKVSFSWEPNYIFKDNKFCVQYLDVVNIGGSKNLLYQAYLPVCLALAALGKVEVYLPGKISEATLSGWKDLIKQVSGKIYKRRCFIKIINGGVAVEDIEKIQLRETGLLFGGGTESLLMLGRLLDKKIKPYLLSLGGSGWLSSDPERNKVKFEQDDLVAREFNLKLIRIRTNFRDLIDDKLWLHYLKKDTDILNSSLFLPFNVSMIYPVAEQLCIGEVVSGNEIENNFGLGLYSFSSDATKALSEIPAEVKYKSYLNDSWKAEIVRNLHNLYPHIAKFQYSCTKNKNTRWCLKCEKCFRNYLILKMYNIDCSKVGLDEEGIKMNLKLLTWKARNYIVRSKTARKMYSYIRREISKSNDADLKKLLRQIYNAKLTIGRIIHAIV